VRAGRGHAGRRRRGLLRIAINAEPYALYSGFLSALDARSTTVVVGAGLAGTAAALTAAEAGGRVVLVEKGERIDALANAVQSGGVLHLGFHGVATPVAELREWIDRTTAGTARPALADAYAAHALESVEWLVAHGIEFESYADDPASQYTFRPRRSFDHAQAWPGGGSHLAMRRLQGSVLAAGGEVRTDTKAVGLIEDGGSVAGVEVRGERGGEVLAAGRVVLADGGFQANPMLVEAHIGRFAERVVLRGARGGTGDALRMAVAIGAKAVGMAGFYGHCLHREALENDRLWPGPVLDMLIEGGVLVDRRGSRFMDEARGGIAAANVVAGSDDPLGTWVITDLDSWETTARNYVLRLPVALPNPELERRGATLVRADDAVGLATSTGMSQEALSGELAAVAAALAAGRGGDLPVPRGGDVRPLRPPYLAIPMVPGITFTMGGLLVDDRARVLDTEERPIPGLYAAGGTMGGLQGGGPRGGYLGGLLEALVFGRIAGGQE